MLFAVWESNQRVSGINRSFPLFALNDNFLSMNFMLIYPRDKMSGSGLEFDSFVIANYVTCAIMT